MHGRNVARQQVSHGVQSIRLWLQSDEAGGARSTICAWGWYWTGAGPGWATGAGCWGAAAYWTGMGCT